MNVKILNSTEMITFCELFLFHSKIKIRISKKLYKLLIIDEIESVYAICVLKLDNMIGNCMS